MDHWHAHLQATQGPFPAPHGFQAVAVWLALRGDSGHPGLVMPRDLGLEEDELPLPWDQQGRAYRGFSFLNAARSLRVYLELLETNFRAKTPTEILFNHFIHVQLFATPWTVAHQALLSMGYSRQEYWSGLPCSPPADLPHPGIKPESPAAPALQADSLPLSHLGIPREILRNSLRGQSIG